MGEGHRKSLTAKALDNLCAGQKVTDTGFDPDGELKGALKGSLIARRRAGRTIVEFFLRMRAGGHDKLHKIGDYAPSGGGIGLAEARRIALQMAKKYANEGAAFKAKREAEAKGAQQAQEADDASQRVSERDSRGESSFGALLLAYIADMRRRARSSADDTEKMIRRHIEVKHPAIWKKPARLITREDIHLILGRMLDAGIRRRVNMMRSVVSSAFQYGLTLSDDSQDHSLAEVFRVTTNPALTIKRRRDLESKGQRVLSKAEIGAYMRALDSCVAGVMQAFLICQIGLAGQRIQQLLRVKWTDYVDGVLRLVDLKGRGGERLHLVPVPDWLIEIIDPLRSFNSEWIFSTGAAPVHPDSVTHAVGRVCNAMLATGESLERFKARDIRRTCETQLAGLRISKDIRTELLSHGRNSLISGRYDHHQYIDEKFDALAAWSKALADWKRE